MYPVFVFMFSYIFKRFKTHFELDRRQAKIYFVLLWFSLLVLCSPLFTYYAYSYFIPKEDWVVTIDTVSILQRDNEFILQKEEQFIKSKPIAKFSELDWIASGMPSYLAKRIMKYQAKGAVLKNLKDLSKVYGMNEKLLEKVKPYVIEEVKETAQVIKKSSQHAPRSKAIVVIDINFADSIILTDLPGIGPVFAKRIIQYRKLLQGYVSKDQYKEIYGLSPFALEVLNKYTTVKPTALGVLGTCDYKKLNEHLYLSSKDARFILSEVNKNKALCWSDFASGLSDKATAHIAELQLYYPCE